MIFQFFNENWPQAVDTLEEIVILIIVYLIFLLILTLFLKISLGFFNKSRHTDFGEVFVTSLFITIFIAVLLLFIGGWIGILFALILMWIIISSRHHVGFAGAIGVTIVALIFYILVIIILRMFLNIPIILPF